MKIKTLFLLVASAALIGSSRAEFANQQAADRVLGQADFISSGAAATQTGLNFPRDVAIDPATGKVFVADQSNSRVLRYTTTASLANGAAAEAVLGQSDFVTGANAVAQNRMDSPTGICLDAAGRLWVADRVNNRVLRFENAATKASGAPADGVLGQATFATNAANSGATGMNNPAGVVADSAGNLWVADRGNNRVLRFTNAAVKLNGDAADVVLGQPDFATVTTGTSSIKMNQPVKVALSPGGALWVVDSNNNRVLRFDAAAGKATGAAADGVLGQADFVTGTAGTTASTLSTPLGAAIDASGTLYVGDFANSRVVFFKNAVSKAPGSGADGVLGQPDFVTAAALITATGMSGPQGVAVDSSGRLYVAQSSGANRVTRYSPIDGTPKLTITGKTTRTTHLVRPMIKGTASSDLGLLKVQFRVGSGAYKTAHGTTAWTARPVVKLGVTNRVTITAVATDGSLTSRTVRVKRIP